MGNPVRVKFSAAGGKDTTEAFHWIIKSTGKWMTDEGNQLTPSDMSGGYAIYAFDLEPFFQDGGYLTSVKQGIVRVIANFSSPLPSTVSCLVYTEGPGYFEIDQSRDVIVIQ